MRGRKPLMALTSDGVEIAVHDLGGRGPSLLLAHATGFCGMAFSPLARSLAREFHCYALDERGHGESGRPANGDFEWTGFARDVRAAVETVGSPPWFGMGHSCGGAALLLAEVDRPGTFESMYLFEPIVLGDWNGPPPQDENQISEVARRRREYFSSREEAYLNYSSKPPLSALSAESLRAYVDFGFADVPGGGVRLRCSPADEAAIFSMASANGAYESLGEVGCRVTVAQGETSDTFAPGYAELLASRMPKATSETLGGLGHFGPLEDPERVAARIVDALLPY